MDVNTKAKIAIFDSDGVLLDTQSLVKSILPKFLQRFEKGPQWLWNIIRKLAILFGGDKVCDDRLKGISVEMVLKIADECEMFVVTKRPFWFGGKKRLMRQLDAVYGEGIFCPANVFSSYLSKHKGEIISDCILDGRFNFIGFMVDDNEKNLLEIPNRILPVWLNIGHKKRVGKKWRQYEIGEMRQLKIVVDLMKCI